MAQEMDDRQRLPSYRPGRRGPTRRLTGGFPRWKPAVLDYWFHDDTFRATIARRDGAPEKSFYDGPPFANGLPHYGHLLTGYVKDIVPRYRTMRGYKVERRFGWDTHGLPAELEVERQLGITDKSQIDAMGITAAFNDACRASVLRYTDEWQMYVTRQARWVDFDNDYETRSTCPTWSRSSLGRSNSFGTRTWRTRAIGCCPTAGATKPHCPITNCGWTTNAPKPPGSRAHGRVQGGRRRASRCLPAGVDDHAVDPAVEPRGGGNPG